MFSSSQALRHVSYPSLTSAIAPGRAPQSYPPDGAAIRLIVGDMLNSGVWAAVRIVTQGRL
jgi:hypothetical protein